MEPGNKTCAFCGNEFVLEQGEIDFMMELEKKGRIKKAEEPKRCQECRKQKKRDRMKQRSKNENATYNEQ